MIDFNNELWSLSLLITTTLSIILSAFTIYTRNKLALNLELFKSDLSSQLENHKKEITKEIEDHKIKLEFAKVLLENRLEAIKKYNMIYLSIEKNII